MTRRPRRPAALALALAAALIATLDPLSGSASAQPQDHPVAQFGVAVKVAATAGIEWTAGTRDADLAAQGAGPELLELPSEGTPVLQVRGGAEVPLRAEPGGEVVEWLRPKTEFGSPTVLSVIEQRGGWAGVSSEHLPNGELGWVELDPGELHAGAVSYEIVVDLAEHSARLLRDGRVKLAWSVSVGAPGTETPTGRFAVTDSLRGGLNPIYGCCAVALSATQPNIPSGWTGGDRIAIHGTTEEVGVANSIGCVRSADADVDALIDLVPLGTPVTIRP